MRSTRSWRVEGSLPPTEGRNWAKSISLTVVADTLEEVALAVRKHHPDVTLFKIIADRSINDVIIVAQKET